MIELLKFVLSSFWKFLGFFLILLVIGEFLEIYFTIFFDWLKSLSRKK